ncbi:LacI family DNA-binding transcriptional regulator [Photobacterium sp. DNB22_13_2]
MATITDVSKLANVSKATVSRVLSGTRGVKEESRLAVLKAVGELNYRPNVAAQNLAKQVSHYIGVVLPSVEATNVVNYLPLLSKGLKSLNKFMLLHYASDADDQRRVIDELQDQCEAIIVMGAPPAGPQPANVVHFDNVCIEGSIVSGYNYAFATESACRYVLGKGHRQIALLVDDAKEAASQQMLDGYRSALQNLSIPFNRQLVVEAKNDVEQGLLALINSFTKYTALVVKRDSHAAQAMRLMREFNIAVPQEVSIISLEDSPLASLLYPPLTCISYPTESLIDDCLKRVQSIVEGKPLPIEQPPAVAGRLVARSSVTTLA